MFVGNRQLSGSECYFSIRWLVIDNFLDQNVTLALDGLMLSVLKEAEGIQNRLMKMVLHL